MSRPIALAGSLILAALTLTACGSTSADEAPGPLGITGSGWFVLILLGLFVLGGAVSDIAARGRRDRRDKDSS